MPQKAFGLQGFYESPKRASQVRQDAATVPSIVAFRIYRRESLGNGHWLGVSKSGLSAGRRGSPVSLSFGRRGLGGSVRLAKGISYLFGRNR